VFYHLFEHTGKSKSYIKTIHDTNSADSLLYLVFIQLRIHTFTFEHTSKDIQWLAWYFNLKHIV